jgi:hypothetical protein
MPTFQSTWEEIDDLRRRYPDALAWGQAGFQGGANVMSKGMTTIQNSTTGELGKGRG